MKVQINARSTEVNRKDVKYVELEATDDKMRTCMLRIWPGVKVQRLIDGSIVIQTRKDEIKAWNSNQAALRLEHCYGCVRAQLVKFFSQRGHYLPSELVDAVISFNETESITVGTGRLEQAVRRVWQMVAFDLHVDDNDEAIDAILDLGVGMYFEDSEKADLEVLTRVHGFDGIRKLLAKRVRLA